MLVINLMKKTPPQVQDFKKSRSNHSFWYKILLFFFFLFLQNKDGADDEDASSSGGFVTVGYFKYFLTFILSFNWENDFIYTKWSRCEKIFLASVNLGAFLCKKPFSNACKILKGCWKPKIYNVCKPLFDTSNRFG